MPRPIYEHKADRERDAVIKKIKAKKALQNGDAAASSAEDSRSSFVPPTPPMHDVL